MVPEPHLHPLFMDQQLPESVLANLLAMLTNGLRLAGVRGLCHLELVDLVVCPSQHRFHPCPQNSVEQKNCSFWVSPYAVCRVDVDLLSSFFFFCNLK